MKTKIILRAIGENRSGKSYLLKKIRDFLKSEGFNVEDKLVDDKHEIVILNQK